MMSIICDAMMRFVYCLHGDGNFLDGDNLTPDVCTQVDVGRLWPSHTNEKMSFFDRKRVRPHQTRYRNVFVFFRGHIFYFQSIQGRNRARCVKVECCNLRKSMDKLC